MTSDYLNLYIKHYIEKDKTGRAIMLTGAWGIGKSHYIKHNLIPFLNDINNGAHACIVVSLYGLNSVAEVSKSIYLEARLKGIRKRMENEAGRTAIVVAKTLLKGVTGFFGVDLTADEDSLQNLYESVDLTGKIVVLEDVERSNISILEILGFVNSLVEQDNIKVMIVTNEDEFLEYDESENSREITSIVGFQNEAKISPAQNYSKETNQYLEAKEKTIGDTIRFEGNPHDAIMEIIKSFEGLRQFATSKNVEDVVTLMSRLGNRNLRSIIYACQKTSDILDQISPETFSDDFVQTIFYGIIAFSLKMHAGNSFKWVGLGAFSQELGTQSFPLFRFCYDYIMIHQLDVSVLSDADKALKTFRLYDLEKTSDDADLQKLKNFHTYTESEVKEAVASVTSRLRDLNDISFHDYGMIAFALTTINDYLMIDTSEARKLLIKNIKGKAYYLTESEVFSGRISIDNIEEEESFIQLREEMLSSLHEGEGKIPEFDYLPEQASLLYEYATEKTDIIKQSRGFAKYLDVYKFVDMFIRSTPAQMAIIRKAFVFLYLESRILPFIEEELIAISRMKSYIDVEIRKADMDAIQRLQSRWFSKNLEDIVISFGSNKA